MNTTTNNSITTNLNSCENCWINNFSAFKNCSSQVRNQILTNTQLRKYNKGETLIKTGDVGSKVFCIQSGVVKVSKTGNKNKEFTLWIARTGDLVGLNSLIDDEPFSFSATAIDHVTACFILADDLKIILQKEPIVSLQLMKTICDKLNFIEQRITSISKKNIRAQCAEILISIASKGQSENDKQLYISYSINDLASLIGTTRNYLYKILCELTNQKVLSVHNRKIIVNNANVLTAIANGDDKNKRDLT